MKTVQAQVLQDCKKFLFPQGEENYICLALSSLRIEYSQDTPVRYPSFPAPPGHKEAYNKWMEYYNAIKEVKDRISTMAYVPPNLAPEGCPPFSLGDMLHYCCGIPHELVNDQSQEMMAYRIRLIDALIEEYENAAA